MVYQMHSVIPSRFYLLTSFTVYRHPIISGSSCGKLLRPAQNPGHIILSLINWGDTTGNGNKQIIFIISRLPLSYNIRIYVAAASFCGCPMPSGHIILSRINWWDTTGNADKQIYLLVVYRYPIISGSSCGTSYYHWSTDEILVTRTHPHSYPGTFK
jgi:hypothetical protein